MIVLHALGDNAARGKLHLWAESSTLPPSTTQRRVRGSKRPQQHPFALALGPLRETVRNLSSIGDGASQAVLPVLLPSTRKGPLPSPQLIREEVIENKDENCLNSLGY
jgi:hypothetical protein